MVISKVLHAINPYYFWKWIRIECTKLQKNAKKKQQKNPLKSPPNGIVKDFSKVS